MGLELLPFGFDEVLRHRQIAIPTVWPPGEADRAQLSGAFDRYLDEGGFPEILGLSDVDRFRVLRDYVDVVLFRDVVERHQATNVPALRRIVHRLASAPASAMSAHKLYNDLRSQGIAVSKDTLYAYLDHVEDAFLGFRVPILTESERVRATNPMKSYPIDVGLARAHSPRPEPGHLLETAVYLELRRRGGDIAWFRTRGGHELDFVVRGGPGDLFRASVALVQVCDELDDPATRTRELRALGEAMGELGISEATVVTRRRAEDVRLDSGMVRIVPAWEWFLRGA
jgi:predicted AAA+ superfamily ATPase